MQLTVHTISGSVPRNKCQFRVL